MTDGNFEASQLAYIYYLQPSAASLDCMHRLLEFSLKLFCSRYRCLVYPSNPLKCEHNTTWEDLEKFINKDPSELDAKFNLKNMTVEELSRYFIMGEHALRLLIIEPNLKKNVFWLSPIRIKKGQCAWGYLEALDYVENIHGDKVVSPRYFQLELNMALFLIHYTQINSAQLNSAMPISFWAETISKLNANIHLHFVESENDKV